jgi:hypothetical protein
MNEAAVIAAMKEVFTGDARMVDHTFKVLDYARRILDGEKAAPALGEVVIPAAIMHDIGIKEAMRKHGSEAAPYQEKEGGPIARAILERLGFPVPLVDRVSYIVAHHHTAAAIDGLDFQIIWEADLLVNTTARQPPPSPAGLKSIIKSNFKTATGTGIARKLWPEAGV